MRYSITLDDQSSIVPGTLLKNPRDQTLTSMHRTLHASDYSGNSVAGKVGGPRFSIAGCAGARRPYGRTPDSRRRSGAGIGPAGGGTPWLDPTFCSYRR